MVSTGNVSIEACRAYVNDPAVLVQVQDLLDLSHALLPHVQGPMKPGHRRPDFLGGKVGDRCMRGWPEQGTFETGGMVTFVDEQWTEHTGPTPSRPSVGAATPTTTSALSSTRDGRVVGPACAVL